MLLLLLIIIIIKLNNAYPHQEARKHYWFGIQISMASLNN